MKNRVLSLLLVTAILMSIIVLPAAAVPTNVVVTVNKQTAKVGDTLVYTLNVTPVGSQTRIRIRVAGKVVYEGKYIDGTVHSYKTKISGAHVAEAIAIHEDITLSAFSVPTNVSKLAAPTGLKVSPYRTTVLKLSWNPVAGVDGYLLLGATSAAGPYTIKRVPSTPYTTVGNLTPGVRYYFKVVGYNLVNNKREEATLRSGYVVGVAVGPTSIVSIVSPSAGRVTLKWSKALGANSYAIYRSTSLNGTYTLVNSTIALSYIDTGLLRGRLYYYKILPRARFWTLFYPGTFSTVKAVRTK